MDDMYICNDLGMHETAELIRSMTDEEFAEYLKSQKESESTEQKPNRPE